MLVKRVDILKAAWMVYFIIVLNFNELPGIQLISLASIVLLTLFCIPLRIRKDSLLVGKWYLMFFVYMSLSFIWAVFKDTSSGVYEATFRVLIFVLCLDLFCDSKERTDYLLDVIVFSGIIYAIHVLLTTPIAAYGTLDVGLSVGAQRNFVGQVCALVSVIAYVLFANEERKSKKRFYCFAILICFFVACISGSRKAFLMVPLALILYVLTQRNLKKKIRYVSILFVISLIFLPIFAQSSYLQEYFGERLLAIFDESITDKSIIGRNYLKTVAISLFSQHPLLGTGCDNVRSYLISIGYPSQVYAHNNYLEILADYGIVGLVLFYNLHIRSLVSTYKEKWDSKYSKLIFVFILTLMFMDYGQVSYQKHMYIYMLVVICSSMKWNKRKNWNDI